MNIQKTVIRDIFHAYKILKTNRTISVNELAKRLFASSATIRRDLNKMESKGLVTRAFCAVTLNKCKANEETPFTFRENANVNNKRKLCKATCSYITNNSSIFIDSSSTLLQLVPYLNDFENLTIITNGLLIAFELITKTKHRVLLLGGTIKTSANSILGLLTLKNIESFHCKFALFSTSALDINFGLSETTIEQSETKKIMIKNSDKSICLVDKSKFNKRSLYKTCNINQLDLLITDFPKNNEFDEFINSTNTQLVYVN